MIHRRCLFFYGSSFELHRFTCLKGTQHELDLLIGKATFHPLLYLSLANARMRESISELKKYHVYLHFSLPHIFSVTVGRDD